MVNAEKTVNLSVGGVELSSATCDHEVCVMYINERLIYQFSICWSQQHALSSGLATRGQSCDISLQVFYLMKSFV